VSNQRNSVCRMRYRAVSPSTGLQPLSPDEGYKRMEAAGTRPSVYYRYPARIQGRFLRVHDTVWGEE
jgi:hypothetical protein